MSSQDPNNHSSSPTNCNYESPVRAVHHKAKLWQNFKTAHDSNNCLAGSSWKVPTRNNVLTWRGRYSTGLHELENVLPTSNTIPTNTYLTGRKIQCYLLQPQMKTEGSRVIELLFQDPNNLSSSPTSCNNESPVRAVQNKAELWQICKTAQDSNNCMAGSSWKVPTGVNEVPWRGRILTGFHELGDVPDPLGSGVTPMHE